MMNEKGRQILYIAVSLDGYIATNDDSLDWLFEVKGDGDNGYGDFIKDIDCIILGRRTYDWIMEKEKDNFPYKKEKCYVFTNRKEQLKYVEVVNEDLKTFINKTRKDYKNIWIVGGGEIIKQYLELDEIDEFRITIAPVILGRGIGLFHEISKKIELELVGVNKRNQFAELIYSRKKKLTTAST
jgi:dihydrofolate reductase